MHNSSIVLVLLKSLLDTLYTLSLAENVSNINVGFQKDKYIFAPYGIRCKFAFVPLYSFIIFLHLLLPLFFQLVTRLHKYGMCLEPKMKYPILEDIGEHFIDRAIALVKSGHKFVYVLGRCENPERRNITEFRGICRNITEFRGTFVSVT